MAKVYRLAVGKSINLHFGPAIDGGGDLGCLLMCNFRVGDTSGWAAIQPEVGITSILIGTAWRVSFEDFANRSSAATGS
jgi:hypothetical protein